MGGGGGGGEGGVLKLSLSILSRYGHRGYAPQRAHAKGVKLSLSILSRGAML